MLAASSGSVFSSIHQNETSAYKRKSRSGRAVMCWIVIPGKKNCFWLFYLMAAGSDCVCCQLFICEGQHLIHNTFHWSFSIYLFFQDILMWFPSLFHCLLCFYATKTSYAKNTLCEFIMCLCILARLPLFHYYSSIYNRPTKSMYQIRPHSQQRQAKARKNVDFKGNNWVVIKWNFAHVFYSVFLLDYIFSSFSFICFSIIFQMYATV